MTKQILVIEDTQEISDLYQMILTDSGFEVSVKNTWGCDRDFDYVKDFQPALVIADLLIKGEVQGLNVVHQLRADNRTSHIPILICSAALGKLREVKQELDENHINVMEKPFDIDALINTVEILTKH